MEKDPSDSDVSSEDLAVELSRLAIDDETFLSPDTDSIVSSTSEETQAVKATSVVPREKLNEYLLSDGIAPIVQLWLEWEQVPDRNKQRYTKTTAEIVSLVLRTISPKDAGSLWQAIAVLVCCHEEGPWSRRPIAAVKRLPRGFGRGLRQCKWLGHEKTDSVHHGRSCQLQGLLSVYTRLVEISLHHSQPSSPAVWARRFHDLPTISKSKS